MTRRRAPEPVWPAIAGRGEPGDLADLVILPPKRYRTRYRVTARGRIWNDRPPEVERVTVTDRDTGAEFTIATTSGAADARLPASMPPDELPGVWRDAVYLAGVARRRYGRPPGSPNKLRSELVAAVRTVPTMTNEEIDRRGVELGIWVDAPGDYDTIRKRVGRIRTDATAQ